MATPSAFSWPTATLSPRTVDRQIEALCHKLGMTRRIGAVVQIVKRGLA